MKYNFLNKVRFEEPYVSMQRGVYVRLHAIVIFHILLLFDLTVHILIILNKKKGAQSWIS